MHVPLFTLTEIIHSYSVEYYMKEKKRNKTEVMKLEKMNENVHQTTANVAFINTFTHIHMYIYTYVSNYRMQFENKNKIFYFEILDLWCAVCHRNTNARDR